MTIGRQINFYALSADHAELEQKLHAAGPFMCVRTRSSSPAPEVHLTTDIGVDAAWSWLLVRPQDLRALATREIPDHGHWVIDNNSDALVIELNRSIQNDRELSRGRFYFRPRVMVDGIWEPKPADFVAWGDKILRIARRFFLREAGDYIGGHALAWLRSNPDAKLRPF